MVLTVFQELRFAGRALAKRRGYAAAAAFTLALGIGANVAIFSVVNAVLLRPLPYPESDRIISIRHHAPGINFPELQSSPGLIDLYRASSRTLTHVAGYEKRQANLTGSGRPERVRTLAVTPEFFATLALRPALGRAFDESDAQHNSPLVGILTHALWQSRFGADPAIVGRQAEVDGKPMEIVGVMPSYFAFPDPDSRLLVPMWLDPARGFGTFGTYTIARLAPNTPVETARQEVVTIQRQIPVRFPDLTQDTLDRFRWSVTLEPLRERIVRDVATPLWILLGSVGFVLLIAGANVANLFLVRAESRRREVAVRAALGASRRRIAVTFLAESLLLAATGGVLGLFLAASGLRALVAFGPAQLPRLNEITVDLTTIAFASILSLAAGVVVGVAPLSGLTRRSFSQVLRDGGRSMTAGRKQHRLRHLLIVGQVAMALGTAGRIGPDVAERRAAVGGRSWLPSARLAYRWCEHRPPVGSHQHRNVISADPRRNRQPSGRDRSRRLEQSADRSYWHERIELRHRVQATCRQRRTARDHVYGGQRRILRDDRDADRRWTRAIA